MGLSKLGMKISMHILVLATVATAAVAQPKPGCQSHCGNIWVPYPFGINDGSNSCYIEKHFLITCNATINPPKAFLTTSNIEVLDISLQGQLRILGEPAYDCNDQLAGVSYSDNFWINLAKFPISDTRNKFTAVGCNTEALIMGSRGQSYATGCLSFCGNYSRLTNGSCSGIGCCQTSIPNGARSYNISISRKFNNTQLDCPCSYAFVVENEAFTFSTLDLKDLRNKTEFPVVLDWAIGNQTCKDAKNDSTTYACKENSKCINSENGPGYRCNCLEGYEGNPYLRKGCLDIDECKTKRPCNSTCYNVPGSYRCSCPVGYEGDGLKNGTGCSKKSVTLSYESKRFPIIIIIALGISMTISVLFVIISLMYCGIQKRNSIKIKEKCFKENGGLMLQQLLSKIERGAERAKIFTEEELKKATNNFNKSEIVGEGGYGTVYKGTLDQRVVAIKKSKVVDHDQIDQFVNEVIVLSQIHHPNVVRLIGCCLETPVPSLVYEFITNKTLYHHIHDRGHMSSMPWHTRLRIAAETAAALAHMHCDAPLHIIHRDVKSANILLDDNFTAKVSDFGVSRLFPLDQTQLPTLVQGTFGYIDPEYFHSGLLNEKSDVYSFGVVIVELLTGESVISPNRPDKDKSLAMYLISSIKDDRLFEILDERVKREGHPEQVKRIAELARRCLRFKSEKRPTMKEVTWELEELRMDKYINVEVATGAEEMEPLLGPPTNFCGSGSSIGPDTLNNQTLLQLASGR